MALSDVAIDKIKEMIVSGQLVPGQRLPREQDLADQFGLSRNSLREAVKALSVIRVLEVRQGDGTYVTSLAPELLLEALSFVLDLRQDDSIVQLLEVRRILEPAATAMAASRLTTEDLDALRATLEQIHDDTPIEELVAKDVEFHHRIAVASGNSYLASMLDSMSSTTIRARIWRGITEARAASRTLDEHRAIVDALAAGEPELARSWATVHVAGVEQWLRRAIETTT